MPRIGWTPTKSIDFARESRDEAIERVTEKAGLPFKLQVLKVMLSMPDTEIIFEDIRIACLSRGVCPHHSEAWGGLSMGFVKNGVLVKTGERGQMKLEKSHAHGTDIYTIDNRMVRLL